MTFTTTDNCLNSNNKVAGTRLPFPFRQTSLPTPQMIKLWPPGICLDGIWTSKGPTTAPRRCLSSSPNRPQPAPCNNRNTEKHQKRDHAPSQRSPGGNGARLQPSQPPQRRRDPAPAPVAFRPPESRGPDLPAPMALQPLGCSAPGDWRRVGAAVNIAGASLAPDLIVLRINLRL